MRLGFEVEDRTRLLAREEARGLARVSPERSFYELRRLIVSQDPVTGIALMDDTNVLAALLPELEALKGVEQNPYHHLDVWGHTLEVLVQLLEVERDLEPVFGQHADGVRRELERPLADELTRGQALRFGALLHDVGKPATRAVTAEGRVLFWGHDELGATMSRDLARRLRASAATGDYLAALARHHLRLGFLVHQRPLTRRDVYRYLRACEPIELEVTVLTAADRLATQGERTRREAIEDHLELARQLAGEALAWRAEPPRPPVTGEDLMDALGLAPGPEVGRLLEELREAAFAGEVGSREDALELARAGLALAVRLRQDEGVEEPDRVLHAGVVEVVRQVPRLVVVGGEQELVERAQQGRGVAGVQRYLPVGGERVAEPAMDRDTELAAAALELVLHLRRVWVRHEEALGLGDRQIPRPEHLEGHEGGRLR